MAARWITLAVLAAGCHHAAPYNGTPSADPGSPDGASAVRPPDASPPPDAAAIRDAADGGTDDAVDNGADETICDDGLPGVLFCDGFENSSGPRLMERVDGEVYVGTTTVYRGQRALYAAARPPQGAAVLSAADFGRVLWGSLHARAYFFVPGGQSLDRSALISFGEMAYALFSVEVQGDRFAIWLGNTQSQLSSATDLPRDRWFCVQFQLAIDEFEGSVGLAIDGHAAIDSHGLDTLPILGIDELAVGLPWIPDAQAEVWVDEVVLSTQPVDCDE